MLYFNYILTVLGQMYYVSMLAITLDHVLEIRLIIKYGLYLSAKKAKVILLVLFSILNLIYFTYLVLVVVYKRYELTFQVQVKFQMHVTPFYHIVFIITAFSVYFNIFRKIHKNRVADDHLKMNVSSNAPIARRKFYLSNILFLCGLLFLSFYLLQFQMSCFLFILHTTCHIEKH